MINYGKAVSGFIFVLTAITMVGCVTTKATSNKSPDFNPKLNRLFITFKATDGSNDFINSLAVKLKTAFGSHGVESTLHVDRLLPLTLESESDVVARNILSGNIYNAEAVMSVEQTENRSYRGVTVGSTLSIRLYLPGSDRPVWRGLITIDNASAFTNLAQVSAGALVKKLQSDQIIN